YRTTGFPPARGRRRLGNTPGGNARLTGQVKSSRFPYAGITRIRSRVYSQPARPRTPLALCLDSTNAAARGKETSAGGAGELRLTPGRPPGIMPGRLRPRPLLGDVLCAW